MSDQFVGEIRMFAGNYAPEDWHLCDGTLLPINGNEALFSLIGAVYGGDGTSTFALPDLRGRVLVHQGTFQGTQGTINYTVGQKGGAETVTLGASQLAAHTHAVAAQNEPGQADTPVNNYWSQAQLFVSPPTPAPPTPSSMSSQLVSYEGGGQAHDNMMPYLAINFIIALTGVYPQFP